MKVNRNIVDVYFEYIEDKYCSKVMEKLIGKKYVLAEQFGSGNLLRVTIEDGLEISRFMITNTMEMDFDNRGFNDDILHVGYCYSGDAKILMLPNNKKYIIKAGDIFVYRMLNDAEYFKFMYKEVDIVSIHMNFDVIKNAINSIGEGKLKMDWQENLNNIFSGDILIIEEASYDIKKIAEEIDSIALKNMMGYMKLKLKTIEFLSILIEEKNNKNIGENLRMKEKECVNKAKNIIDNNLQGILSVKELASVLNTSVYKLQKGFKNFTGDTVYEYIKRARIERAEYLLENTDMSIIQITNEIGYENPSKFANLFKRYNDVTPLKYRKLRVEN